MKKHIQEWKADPIQSRNNMDLGFIRGCFKGLSELLQMAAGPDWRQREYIEKKFNAFDRRYIALTGINPDSTAAQFGTLAGEMASPMIATNFVSAGRRTYLLGRRALSDFRSLLTQLAKDFKVAELLQNRTLNLINGAPGRDARLLADRIALDMRALERLNRPALRRGIAAEKTVRRLAERNISKVRTDWVLPKKGGAMINGRWYTEHALERMAPRTPEVMAELEARALQRAAKEGFLPQTEKFGEWMKKHDPDPRNIPPSVVEAEIVNPGSINIRVELNTSGEVITVIPRG